MIWGAMVEIHSNNPGHSHDMYELGVSINGNGDVEIGTKTYQRRRGNMFLFPAGCFHKGSADKGNPVKAAFLCFDRNYFFDKGNVVIAELINQLESGQHYCSGYTSEFAEDNVRLITQAVQETTRLSLYAEEKVESLLIQLLINFARNLQLDANSNQTAKKQRLHALCKQINEKPAVGKSLLEAAKFAGMSRTGFMVLFKELTGTSYIEYVNLAKVKRAMKLCENPDLSISEIAYQSGFSNLGHFHRKFKTVSKMTPFRFKRFIQKNGPFPTILDYL